MSPRFRELDRAGRKRLFAAGIEEAAHDARALLSEVSGLDAVHWPLREEEEAPEEVGNAYEALLLRRERREPLQQILGRAPFFGRTFSVDAHVLVPRFDTETLVAEVLPHLAEGMKLLDLCTGSGCILLTLLLEGPRALYGLGTDLSADALRVAGRNLQAFEEELSGKGSRAEFLLGDLFLTSPARGGCDKMSYDVIVSNPPYIPSGEIADLAPEVRVHEPRMALDGGADGLTFYRRIIAEAPRYLKEGGLLAFECGYDQTEDLMALMDEAGFRSLSAARDTGGMPRVVSGRKI